jgi:hypothetical protein
MSRSRSRREPPPLAIDVDGDVYVNVLELVGGDVPEDVIEFARARPRVFVGIGVTSDEMCRIHGRLVEAAREATALVAGARRRR